MRPVVCMVTARSRFGETWERRLVEQVAASARAGVNLIQIREGDLEARPLVALVGGCMEAVRGTPARLLVSDRTDVALASGAHGVHLRGDSPEASRIRQIVPPGFLVGRSIHSRAEAIAAEATGGLDYLLFGTVFETASKPGKTPEGLGELQATATAVRLPVLAIGGVTLDRLPALARAKAAGFAAIGLFADADPRSLEAIVRQAVQSFDTPDPVP